MQRLRRLLFLGLACWSLAGVAMGQSALSAEAARSVRATVSAQLDAMAAGDAERAFSYAAAGIRQQFGDAATFMTMVQRGYPMVIRPAARTWFVPLATPDGATQELRLQDADGRLWLATYALVRQADGAWRISGCSVVADSGGRSV